MEQERDRRYSSLIGSIFNESLDHGLLADERKGLSDDFLREFIQRPGVTEAAEQFIRQISSLLSSAREQAATAAESQDITSDASNVLLSDQKPSAQSEHNHGSNARIIKNGIALDNVKPVEWKKLEPLPSESLSTTLGNDAVSSKQTNDAVSAPSHLSVPPPTQLPKKPLPISNSTSAPKQQLKPGVVPLCQSPKQQATLNQVRSTFSIATNGKVNEPFRCRIEGKATTKAKVVVQGVDVPEGLGLTLDQASGELHGTPIAAGDYKLKVYFQFEPPGIHGPKLLEGECSLVINPDPKTLWKNVPSDQNDPYWKKDEDSLTIQGEDGMRMIAVSKRGRSHAHVGSFRDDDFCLYGKESNGWRVLTVADGAGSAKKSRRGSYIASRKASELVLKNLLSIERGRKLEQVLTLWEVDNSGATKPIKDELYYLFGQAAQEAVRAIDEEANTNGIPYKDYSTTLLIAVHKKFEVGHFIGAYWLGDGAIGLYRRGHEIRVMGKADSGEFAGQTRFLDSAMVNNAKEIWDRINFEIVPDFTAIAVMSDGISDPHFETDANLEKVVKWDQLWEQIEPLLNGANPEADLLTWLDFWSPGNHDDRTIALLCADNLSNQQGGIKHE